MLELLGEAAYAGKKRWNNHFNNLQSTNCNAGIVW